VTPADGGGLFARRGCIVVKSEGPRAVTIEFEGRTITASYKASHGIITVTSKRAQPQHQEPPPSV
jgi:hypothetical protein